MADKPEKRVDLRPVFRDYIAISVLEGYAGVPTGTWWKRGRSALPEIKKVLEDVKMDPNGGPSSAVVDKWMGENANALKFFLTGVAYAATTAKLDPNYRRLNLNANNVLSFVDVDWMRVLTKPLGKGGPLFYSVGRMEREKGDFKIGRVMRRLVKYSGLSPGAYNHTLRWRRPQHTSLNVPVSVSSMEGPDETQRQDVLVGRPASLWGRIADILQENPTALRQLQELAFAAIDRAPVKARDKDMLRDAFKGLFVEERSEQSVRRELQDKYNVSPPLVTKVMGKGFSNLFDLLKDPKIRAFLKNLMNHAEFEEDVGMHRLGRRRLSRRRPRL